MPDRILRDELAKSGRWLDLKDNTDRVAFILCILIADDFGNFEANPGDLIRLWRDVGVNSTEIAAKIARELCDADLVRWYEWGGKRYGHIPTFKQRLRYFKRAHPRPSKVIEEDESTTETRQREGISLSTVRLQSDSSQTVVSRSEVKRSEEIRSEVKRSASAQNEQLLTEDQKRNLEESRKANPMLPTETLEEHSARLFKIAGIIT